MRELLTMPSSSLTRPEILVLLPYGNEFLFVDEAESHESRRLTTRHFWGVERPEIAAHFARGPKLVPGTLLAEQAAQSALLLAILEGYQEPGTPMLLGQFRCQITYPAVAPCSVVVDVTVDVVVGHSVGFSATCLLGEHEIAKIRGVAAPMKEGFFDRT
jgi:3-hydroxymyristoyl/3-hydroxydecanoyl-(acyl carrier protein) dehydratase